MDRKSWMYGRRDTSAYLLGVEEFINCAKEHMRRRGDETILCPCSDCENLRRFRDVREVRGHLIRRGFKERYTRWVWHGECFEESANAESSKASNVSETSLDRENDVREEIGVENIENIDSTNCTDYDQVDEMMHDIPDDFVDIPEFSEINLSKDANVELFPGCTKFSKLSAVFKLFSLKAKNNWSDKSFTDLLKLLGDMLPEDNELPDTTYQAKKILCPLSLTIDRIPTCPKDCVLYRKEHVNLDKCPKCGLSRYKPGTDPSKKGKKPAAKILYYLPVEPRLRRLFANPRDAELLQWAGTCRKDDGMLRHPADSSEWRKIDMTFPDFGGEPRNLRLGLCTDGMNPYGNMSSRHSTWPVFLCIYNLPPWLCMKRKYLMMPLLISGPKQPGNDIDVFLAPLIEELEKLWKEGIRVYDAYKKEWCTIRVMIFCTVNDFPALGNLSGCRTKGYKACPVCGEQTCSIRLKHCKKIVYMGHRRFLRVGHAYRGKKKEFNGKSERRKAPVPLTGKEVYTKVKHIRVQFGKDVVAHDNPDDLWKKRSIFWDLPYWPHMDVRHCLDLMHIVKNVAESIVGLLLNTAGKTKDGINVRKDMVEMGIRPELAPQEKGERTFLPAACYTLSRKEKISFLECLQSIRVPSGYASNISRRVSMKDMKLIGMKSHDYHVLLTQLLPVAIRGILPPHVRKSITRFCSFFNKVNSKVIDPEGLDFLQSDVVTTLCELEMYLPPSFFDIMVHLTVHLVREIKLCGPPFLRQMYPFERAMGQLKGLVRSRSRPEGSMVEGYDAEEIIGFYTDYVADIDPIGLPKPRHEGRLQGVGTIGYKLVRPDHDLIRTAHLKILQHLADVSPYVVRHLTELREKNPSRSESWVTNEHNRTFIRWFEDSVHSRPSDEDVSETIRWLAFGPGSTVHTYQGFDMNGFTWYTRTQDSKSTVQNSGVTLVALAASGDMPQPFYGWIEEIWEVDYVKFKIPLFYCKWIDNGRGVQRDEDGFVTVDFSRLGYHDDPFILAKQAKQVFYVVDPADKKRHVVLAGKRHIVGIGDVVDEDDYDKFDETGPFCNGTAIQPVDDAPETIYIRTDHDEGTWLKRRKKKKSKGSKKRKKTA